MIDVGILEEGEPLPLWSGGVDFSEHHLSLWSMGKSWSGAEEGLECAENICVGFVEYSPTPTSISANLFLSSPNPPEISAASSEKALIISRGLRCERQETAANLSIVTTRVLSVFFSTCQILIRRLT